MLKAVRTYCGAMLVMCAVPAFISTESFLPAATTGAEAIAFGISELERRARDWKQALRMLEAEREIPMDRLIPTIEQALLMAYHRSPGALKRARGEIDRVSGHVTVWATELDEDGNSIWLSELLSGS